MLPNEMIANVDVLNSFMVYIGFVECVIADLLSSYITVGLS